MKLSRALSLFLAAASLLLALSACKPKDPASSDATDATQPVETGLITSVSPQDYEGTPFTFLTQGTQERFHKEIFVEAEDTEEAIYQSVYQRNQFVNEYLHIEIKANVQTNALETAR